MTAATGAARGAYVDAHMRERLAGSYSMLTIARGELRHRPAREFVKPMEPAMGGRNTREPDLEAGR